MFDTGRVLASASLFVVISACSGQAEEGELPPAAALCDGSDDSRLVFASVNGFGHFGSRFSGVYGSSFVAIDGRCNYWLGSETLRGLRTGVLDADAAVALADELHFGRYFSVADYRDPGGCTDAGLFVLDDGTAALRGTCGFDGAPRVYSEAFRRIHSLVEELDASGAPSWQPSTLLALRDPSELFPGAPSSGSRGRHPTQRRRGFETSCDNWRTRARPNHVSISHGSSTRHFRPCPHLGPTAPSSPAAAPAFAASPPPRGFFRKQPGPHHPCRPQSLEQWSCRCRGSPRSSRFSSLGHEPSPLPSQP